MRKNYSTPVMARPARTAQKSSQGEQDEEKQVDYSHLDIIAEVERITGCSLSRVSRKGVYSARCPFPGCPSMHDAFTVWDIPVLGKRANGKSEVHFWCRRCDRSGDLISLLRQYREATTGEALTWKQAALELRIDPRTWRMIDDQDQENNRTHVNSIVERRQKEDEDRRKLALAELAMLDGDYLRACAALAKGSLVRKDGTKVAYDLARVYLQERGFTLEQAAKLGMAYLPKKQEIGSDEGEYLGKWRGRVLFPLAGPKGFSGYAGRTVFLWQSGMSAEQHKKLLDAWNEKHKDDRKSQVQRTEKTRAGQSFYGYDQVCYCSTLVIVEGEFDAASVRLALGNSPAIAVCAFGKNFQARMVPLNVLHAILALDIDQAGQEKIASHTDELEARGMTVSIARPPMGKDWNDCHVMAGLEAIRGAILQVCPEFAEVHLPIEQGSAGAGQCEQMPISVRADGRIEPPGYMDGNVCLLCGEIVRDEEGAFEVDELGDLYCIDCWKRQNPEQSCRRW